MPDLETVLVDAQSFGEIPSPAAPGAGCQTCDYWERIDGGREPPETDAGDDSPAARLKLSRLLAGERLAGSYAMLAYRTDAVARTAVGYAQFGPLSAYPRAGVIRERYPDLPDAPAPWVITCLQVVADRGGAERVEIGASLLGAVCAELDQRGVGAVEAYPEAAADPWLPPAGPSDSYEEAGFARVAGDERYPVYRRELTGEADEGRWGALLRAGQPTDDDAWPVAPQRRDEDDFFRLPPEGPRRPNPFGDD